MEPRGIAPHARRIEWHALPTPNYSTPSESSAILTRNVRSEVLDDGTIRNDVSARGILGVSARPQEVVARSDRHHLGTLRLPHRLHARIGTGTLRLHDLLDDSAAPEGRAPHVRAHRRRRVCGPGRHQLVAGSRAAAA